MLKVLIVGMFWMARSIGFAAETSKTETAKTLVTDASFWGYFAGFVFLFIALVEFAKKVGWYQSSEDKAIQDLAKLRQQLIPSDLPLDNTPVGIALKQIENHEKQMDDALGVLVRIQDSLTEMKGLRQPVNELHDLVYDERGQVFLHHVFQRQMEPTLKILHAYELLLREQEKKLSEMTQKMRGFASSFEELEKISETTSLNLQKMTELLAIQNKRIKQMMSNKRTNTEDEE